MLGVTQANNSNKTPAVHSQAKIIGLLADGYRFLLIFNHLLDNTKQPKPEDFTLTADGRVLPVKAAFLASPMLQNSSWAAVTLLLGEMVPKSVSIRVEYQQPLNIGLLSLVDKKRLAPLCIEAWSDQAGALSLGGRSADSMLPASQVAPRTSLDLAPLNALRQRLDAADAVKVQEELFEDYVSSMFDDVFAENDIIEKAAMVGSSVDSAEIPTLTLVAPNPARPLPVKAIRADKLEGQTDEIKVPQLSNLPVKPSEKKRESLMQTLFNSTTGLMMGRGALIRSK
jgi:hypothetical protein